MHTCLHACLPLANDLFFSLSPLTPCEPAHCLGAPPPTPTPPTKRPGRKKAPHDCLSLTLFAAVPCPAGGTPGLAPWAFTCPGPSDRQPGSPPGAPPHRPGKPQAQAGREGRAATAPPHRTRCLKAGLSYLLGPAPRLAQSSRAKSSHPPRQLRKHCITYCSLNFLLF